MPAKKKPAKKKPAANKKTPAKKKPAKKKPAKKKTPAKKAAKPLWSKLHVKGGSVLTMNVPKGYEGAYAGSPATIATQGPADWVHLWVKDLPELVAHLANASRSVRAGGNLVISYPKGKKDVHRDTLWVAAGNEGWEGVALVAVDATWSAMRFREKG